MGHAKNIARFIAFYHPFKKASPFLLRMVSQVSCIPSYRLVPGHAYWVKHFVFPLNQSTSSQTGITPSPLNEQSITAKTVLSSPLWLTAYCCPNWPICFTF